MTLREFGQFLKTQFHKKDHLPDEMVAVLFLRDYPQYSDLVDSAQNKISQILTRTGFWASVTAEEKAQTWSHRSLEADSINKVQIALEAATVGVDTPTLMTLKLTDAHIRGQMALMQKEFELKVELMKQEAAHAQVVYQVIQEIQSASHKRNALPQTQPEEPRALASGQSSDDERSQQDSGPAHGHESESPQDTWFPKRRDPGDFKRRGQK